MTKRAKNWARLTCVIGFVLGLAGLAWGCTVNAHISMVPVSGPGELTIFVTGDDFSPGVPVEIRWNTADGALVGSAQGPSFSVPVKVPAGLAPDFYYVVALQPSKAGSTGGKAVAAYEVTAPAAKGNPEAPAGSGHKGSKTATSELWQAFRSTSNGSSSLDGAAPKGSAERNGQWAFGLMLFAAGLVAVTFVAVMHTKGLARGKGDFDVTPESD